MDEVLSSLEIDLLSPSAAEVAARLQDFAQSLRENLGSVASQEPETTRRIRELLQALEGKSEAEQRSLIEQAEALATRIEGRPAASPR